ncbi:hypothetical protein MNBD_UNCLBAC01-226, partial [hydrothermal vent metagenome]
MKIFFKTLIVLTFILQITPINFSHSATTTIDYTYDDLNRLENSDDNSITHTFTYDEVGNITSKKVVGSGSTSNINFNNYSVENYDQPGNNFPSTATIENQGLALRISGNGWRKI